MSAPSHVAVSRRALLGLSEPAPLETRIDASCFAKRNILCESCADACEPRAIRFTRHGAIKEPHIDLARCTACGECVAACPANAIVVAPRETQGRPR